MLLAFGGWPSCEVDLAERPVDLALGDAGVGVDVLQHERLVDLARLLPVLGGEVQPAEAGHRRDVGRVDAQRLLVRGERARRDRRAPRGCRPGAGGTARRPSSGGRPWRPRRAGRRSARPRRAGRPRSTDRRAGRARARRRARRSAARASAASAASLRPALRSSSAISTSSATRSAAHGDGGDPALQHVGEQRASRRSRASFSSAAIAPACAGIVLERLLEVLDRGVGVGVADARDLAEPEEQIGGVAPGRRQLERLLERRLALVPVARALVDLRQPRQRGDRAGLAREDLLEDLAGGVGVVELALPDVGGAGERRDLGRGVAERRVRARRAARAARRDRASARRARAGARARRSRRRYELSTSSAANQRAIASSIESRLSSASARHLGVDRDLVPASVFASASRRVWMSRDRHPVAGRGVRRLERGERREVVGIEIERPACQAATARGPSVSSCAISTRSAFSSAGDAASRAAWPSTSISSLGVSPVRAVDPRELVERVAIGLVGVGDLAPRRDRAGAIAGALADLRDLGERRALLGELGDDAAALAQRLGERRGDRRAGAGSRSASSSARDARRARARARRGTTRPPRRAGRAGRAGSGRGTRAARPGPRGRGSRVGRVDDRRRRRAATSGHWPSRSASRSISASACVRRRIDREPAQRRVERARSSPSWSSASSTSRASRRRAIDRIVGDVEPRLEHASRAARRRRLARTAARGSRRSRRVCSARRREHALERGARAGCAGTSASTSRYAATAARRVARAWSPADRRAGTGTRRSARRPRPRRPGGAARSRARASGSSARARARARPAPGAARGRATRARTRRPRASRSREPILGDLAEPHRVASARPRRGSGRRASSSSSRAASSRHSCCASASREQRLRAARRRRARPAIARAHTSNALRRLARERLVDLGERGPVGAARRGSRPAIASRRS